MSHSADDEPQCIVCHDSLTEEAQVELSPCGHKQFCNPCIDRWIKEKHTPSCPYCRTKIDKLIIGTGDEIAVHGRVDPEWAANMLLHGGVAAIIGFHVVIRAIEIFGQYAM
jgi:hypothetical protein